MMTNFSTLNESVAAEMARLGVGKKAIRESEDKPKRITVKVTTKDGDHWTTGFNGTAEEAKSYFMGKRFERRDETKGEPVTKVEVLESITSLNQALLSEAEACSNRGVEYFEKQAAHLKDLIAKAPGEDKIKLREMLKLVQDRMARCKKTVDEAEGDTDNDPGAFGAGAVESDPIEPTDTETDTPAVDDEAGEEQEDPTREKLETPEDEADEQKGGAAELAADLRVSVRIEKMNLNRYKRMLDKHDLSEDGTSWLKQKMEDIQAAIDDMQERIPQLEKEAEETGVADEVQAEIQESFKAKLKRAIVEIASGR